ncbi:MAG: hypothetical protein ACR2OZ_13595 [Verrucomicrobiales bacterium]
MVWSDAEVQKLAASFISAADASDRLQAPDCRDEDAQLFQKFGGKRTMKSLRAGDGLGQGQYAVSPSGELLASCATSDPREVARMLADALAKWNELPRERRLLPGNPSPEAARKWRHGEELYPADGLVLSVVARDLPRSTQIASVFEGRWNQDFAWFRKAEARAFVPEKFETGATCEIPRPLVDRLVRLHLVDHVRALNYDFFKPEEVQAATLTATIGQVTSGQVLLRFEGSTRAVAAGPSSRGYDSKLMGRATWNIESGRFTGFELISVGQRWGAGNCNQRHDDSNAAPMGIALELAGQTPADRLPPAFLSEYGWSRPISESTRIPRSP